MGSDCTGHMEGACETVHEDSGLRGEQSVTFTFLNASFSRQWPLFGSSLSSQANIFNFPD